MLRSRPYRLPILTEARDPTAGSMEPPPFYFLGVEWEILPPTSHLAANFDQSDAVWTHERETMHILCNDDVNCMVRFLGVSWACFCREACLEGFGGDVSAFPSGGFSVLLFVEFSGCLVDVLMVFCGFFQISIWIGLCRCRLSINKKSVSITMRKCDEKRVVCADSRILVFFRIVSGIDVYDFNDLFRIFSIWFLKFFLFAPLNFWFTSNFFF